MLDERLNETDSSYETRRDANRLPLNAFVLRRIRGGAHSGGGRHMSGTFTVVFELSAVQMKVTSAGILEVRRTSLGSELTGRTFDRLQLRNLRLSFPLQIGHAGGCRPAKSGILTAPLI